MANPTVFVGTRSGLYVVGNDGPAALEDRSVDHLHMNGADLWALADGSSLVLNPRTSAATEIAELTSEHANCLLVAGDVLHVGASRAVLYEMTHGELRRSKTFDDAPGRSSWYTPWGGPPDVRSLAAGVEGNIYVNVHVGGVVRSSDGGTSWADTMDIDSDVHEVVADPDRPNHAYVAAAIGLGKTTDGGDTWRFETSGLDGSYCRAVTVSTSYVFVSASFGPGGRRAAIYRTSRQDGGAIERCEGGLPNEFTTNVDTFCLAAKEHFVVAADPVGAVYASSDEGDTWQVVAEGLPTISCVAIR